VAKQTGPVFCWVNQCPTSFSGRRWTPWRSSVGFGVVGGRGVTVRAVQCGLVDLGGVLRFASRFDGFEINQN
jgi:hypothetical protein